MKEVAFFLKAFLIPAFCYLPAFGLVWLSSNVFKPTTANTQISEMGTLEKQVETEVKKQLNLRRAVPQGELQKQISDEVKKATREEIENQENKVKGDLFGQISFPVLFAIASIFAAFAVKDILTEILKEQEKEKIKQELKQELETQIVPEAIVFSRENISRKLQEVEDYAYWLEHEFLNVAINQVFSEINKSSIPISKEIETRSLTAVEALFERADIALNRISSSFKKKDLELLRKAEYGVLEAQMRSIKLSQESKDCLLSMLKEKSQVAVEQGDQPRLPPEDCYKRMDDVFQIQMRLLIVTLSKIRDNDNNSERSSTNDLISEILNYVNRDVRRELEDRGERFDALSRHNPPLQPLD